MKHINFKKFCQNHWTLYTIQCHVLTVTHMPQVQLMTEELPKVYIFGARTFVMQGAPADRRLMAGSYTVHLPPADRAADGSGHVFLAPADRPLTFRVIKL
jgi:hypothetical protein